MIAELGGLEEIQREAHRIFVRTLVRRVTEVLDGMAGPRALTPGEREIQELCRDRFELYDPTCERQIEFVLELRALAEAAHSKPAPTRRAPARPPDDDLMAALLRLQEPPRPQRPRPVVRHRRPDPIPAASRRPESRGPESRDSDWDRYLVKWRAYEE